jgi:hypothetical protein
VSVVAKKRGFAGGEDQSYFDNSLVAGSNPAGAQAL